MLVLEIFLICGSLIILLPACVFFTQILLALLPQKKTPEFSSRPSIAILMPAHNEATVIGNTLQALLPQLTKTDRVIVIADNCSDNTAQTARDAGASVIERHDDIKRGKGYALDFGVRNLHENPPDIVVIVDADCIVHEGALDRLARLCSGFKTPVQAQYLMQSPPNPGIKTQIAEFAWLVKNLVRPRGYLRIGLPCPLMGSGMAFPWQVIAESALASGNIVEDLKLGIDLNKNGVFTHYCPEALVTSRFPDANDTLSGQRTRWEHGHLSVIFSEFPAMFTGALKKFDPRLMAMALDLLVPPLALLCMLMAALTGISGLFYGISGNLLPLLLSGGALAMVGLAVFSAWFKFGRHIISFAGLAKIPVYLAWKIPVYLKFLFKRQQSWVKTKR
jgi:cellulose synthase/poly-beta-1,6-N-acetylglucosamine synthase-like glycosyltransferase